MALDDVVQQLVGTVQSKDVDMVALVCQALTDAMRRSQRVRVRVRFRWAWMLSTIVLSWFLSDMWTLCLSVCVLCTWVIAYAHEHGMWECLNTGCRSSCRSSKQ